MSRFNQLLFAVSIAMLSWYAVMAVHELGHVVGAVFSGGSIERVVLHPLKMSRTDVSPNPNPAIVVWLGPVVGCLLPSAVFAALPKHLRIWRSVALFFTGFCLIANGAYISVGSFQRIGDCGEMLRTGSPQWLLIVFGAVTIPLGFNSWHRLGSLNHFISNPSVVGPRMAYLVFGTLLATFAAGLALSRR